jgi:hypothetical protein
LIVGLGTVPAAQAQASVSWSGKTDQGLPMTFTIREVNHQAVISSMELQFMVTCEMTGTELGLDIIWPDANIPIKHNRWSFYWNDMST